MYITENTYMYLCLYIHLKLIFSYIIGYTLLTKEPRPNKLDHLIKISILTKHSMWCSSHLRNQKSYFHLSREKDLILFITVILKKKIFSYSSTPTGYI